MRIFRNKKILIMLLVALLGIAYIAAGATYAYLNATSSKTNQFTIGENKVVLREDFTPPEDIHPGDRIKKKAWVENVGNTDTYVRARILFSDSDMQNNCEPLVLGNDWVYNSNDDYYYYTKKVEVGAKTSNLIEYIKIKSRVEESNVKSFSVSIYVESKTNHRSDDYQEAWNM